MPKRLLRLSPHHTQLASTLCSYGLSWSLYQALRLGLSSTWTQSSTQPTSAWRKLLVLHSSRPNLPRSVCFRTYPEELVEICLSMTCYQNIQPKSWNSFVRTPLTSRSQLASLGVSWRHVFAGILTAHSCQSISMNLTWCQVARLIHTAVGKFHIRNDIAQNIKRKLCHWVDADWEWDGCWRWR